MLPSPAVTKYQRRIHFNPTSPRNHLIDKLRKQSRLTNLGVFILIGTCSISILLNLGYWFSVPHSSGPYPFDSQRPTERQRLSHLVVVPCHSIWSGTNSWTEEKDWMLESYQKGPGRVKAFYEHILKGAEVAKADPDSLLIFSGGQTKHSSSTTEAESYLRLGLMSGILPDQFPTTTTTTTQGPFGRATTENFALDSYQNLLFSIARFREYTGRFPAKITVVGYGFKRPRFQELHRPALRWPETKFRYIGVDPEHPDEDSTMKAVVGEQQNGYLPYTLDTYGCHSTLLRKRRLRNPHTRFHPYSFSVPELVSLFAWCPGDGEGGAETVFPGDLPWQQLTLRRESS